MIRLPALALLSLPLVACASTGDKYPSLAIRDAERTDVKRVEGSFEPGTPTADTVTPAPPSADLVQRLAQLRAEAQSAHRQFVAAAPSATRLAGAAGSTGSDSWASAQVALADLDSLRSQAAIALAELDILFIDSAIAAERRTEIANTRDEVIALVSEEDTVLARLRDRVGG